MSTVAATFDMISEKRVIKMPRTNRIRKGWTPRTTPTKVSAITDAAPDSSMAIPMGITPEIRYTIFHSIERYASSMVGSPP
jgi:hypothetical protein